MTLPGTGADQGLLAEDTSRAAEDLQVARWQTMSPAEKAMLSVELSHAADRLALAGIRDRHPHASERECFLRLAALKLGLELASRVYPEIRDLDEIR